MYASVSPSDPRANPPGAAAGDGWSAALDLGVVRSGERSVLGRRRHQGPLHVQKALYPEGGHVCHLVLVHPPGGIVGGDRLAIDLDVGAGAHALVTTPGATKWYGSAARRARQDVRLTLSAGSVLEWLPQETIVFDAADAEMTLAVDMAPGAGFVGMEVLCLGRTASGETFTRGRLAVGTTVAREGAKLWLERGVVRGGDPLLQSPVGFAGAPVTGTLIVASAAVTPALRDACRDVAPCAGRGAVTLLPGLLVARYLGPGTEPARAWLAALWCVVRPTVAGTAPMLPRLWST